MFHRCAALKARGKFSAVVALDPLAFRTPACIMAESQSQQMEPAEPIGGEF
jgi:hypothetical protein